MVNVPFCHTRKPLRVIASHGFHPITKYSFTLFCTLFPTVQYTTHLSPAAPQDSQLGSNPGPFSALEGGMILKPRLVHLCSM